MEKLKEMQFEEEDRTFAYKQLARQLYELGSALSSRRRINQILLGLAVVTVIGAVVYWLYGYYWYHSIIYQKISLISIGIGVALAAIRYLLPLGPIEKEIEDTLSQLEMVSIPVDTVERRAEKLFKNHRIHLEMYYDQNLRQSKSIFYFGIVCMVAGFAIIGVTIYFLFSKIDMDLNDKIVTAAFGIIGTILTDYIGTIYLRVFSKTTETLTEFHDKLVFTHHLHFSNFLTSKIKKTDEREKILAAMALKITEREIEETKSKKKNKGKGS